MLKIATEKEIKTRVKHYVLILVLFLLIGLLFGPNLNSPLLSDDYVWVRDVAIFNSFGDFFKAHFALKETDFRYRPLMPTVIRLCYQISGSEPFCMHLAGFSLHFLNTVLVGRLYYLITKNKWAAWASMFFFAVYFTHVETVAWISDLGNLLAAFFMLITSILFLLFTTRYRYYLWILSLCTFILALISKESALALTPILVAWGIIIYWRKADVYHRKLIILAGSSYILLFGVYVFIINRTGLIFAFSGEGNYTYKISLLTLRNIINYPLNFFWPTDFNILELLYQHLYDIYRTYSGFSNDTLVKIFNIPNLAWILGGTLLFWLGTIWLLWRHWLIDWLALVWLILGILPVIFIAGHADRHMYVASIGLSLIVGSLTFGDAKIHKTQPLKLRRFIPTFIFATILAVNIYWTHLRVQNWQVAGYTADTIVSTVIKKYPDLPAKAELWFVGLPDNFNGAYIFRLGIDAALQMKINNTNLAAHKLSKVDGVPRPLTANQYVFLYQDGQLLDLTPEYRSE